MTDMFSLAKPLPVTNLAFILAWAQGRPSQSTPLFAFIAPISTGQVPNPLLTHLRVTAPDT